MLRKFCIFSVLTLCALPVFGANNPGSENTKTQQPVVLSGTALQQQTTVSMATVCKNSVGRLNCTNLTITCTNGFNEEWTAQTALEAMCPNEFNAQTEEVVIEKTKKTQKPILLSDCTDKIDNAARAIYELNNHEHICTLKECKCGYDITSNTCKQWPNPAPSCTATNAATAHKACDDKGKEICIIDTCNTDTPVLNKEKNKCEKCPRGQEPDNTGGCKNTAKTEQENKEKQLCETGPNKGTWNQTLKKCNCPKKTFFDDNTGCVTETTEFTNAKKQIEELQTQLETKINALKK